MEFLALIIAIAALVFSALAYQKTGGKNDLKNQIDNLGSIVDSLREKIADSLDKLEKMIRKEEQPKKDETTE